MDTAARQADTADQLPRAGKEDTVAGREDTVAGKEDTVAFRVDMANPLH